MFRSTWDFCTTRLASHFIVVCGSCYASERDSTQAKIDSCCFPLFRLVGNSIRHFRRDGRMENESDLTPVPTTPVELISSAPNEELAPTDSKLNEDRPAVPEEVAAPLAGGLEEEGGVPGGARDAEGARAEEEERGGEAVALESVAEGKAVGELDTRAEEVAAEKQIDIKVDSTSEAAATAPAVAGSPSEPAVVVEAVDTAVSLVEPIPSKTPSTLTSTLLPSNPPSRAPTPTLTPSGPTPPPPSVSPAPPKKFASSLSVNKKFLEKAGEKSKPEVKAAVGTSRNRWSV